MTSTTAAEAALNASLRATIAGMDADAAKRAEDTDAAFAVIADRYRNGLIFPVEATDGFIALGYTPRAAAATVAVLDMRIAEDAADAAVARAAFTAIEEQTAHAAGAAADAAVDAAGAASAVAIAALEAAAADPNNAELAAAARDADDRNSVANRAADIAVAASDAADAAAGRNRSVSQLRPDPRAACGTYYHVAGAGYEAGDDLLSWNAFLDERGVAPGPWKWTEAPEAFDGDVVSLFERYVDALDYRDGFGGTVLAVDLPEDADELGIMAEINDEGYLCIYRRIPSSYLSPA